VVCSRRSSSSPSGCARRGLRERGPAALLPAALCVPAGASGRAVYLGLGRGALIAPSALNPLSLIAIGTGGARAIESTTGTHRPP